MTDPETHAAQLHFAKTLGVKFIDVWTYARTFDGMRWCSTQHVDDTETFLETVDMALEREGLRFALWDDGDKWCLLDRRTGDTKRYPNRAAAEMVAIHVR